MSPDALPQLALVSLLFILVLPLVFVLRENRKLAQDTANLAHKYDALKQSLTKANAAQLETLRQSEFHRLASESAPDGIIVQDMAGRILWSNPAFSKIHQRSAQDVRGKHPLEFAHPTGKTPDATVIDEFTYVPDDPCFDTLQVIKNKRSNGEIFWNQISVSFSKCRDGHPVAVQVCRDVTTQIEQSEQLQALSQKLEHEANHDELTGASNRGAFLTYFDELVDAPDQAPVGILHIDLDNFKHINDTHGHAAGDAVLVHVTNALQTSVRPTDMVSRIGGDEFVITCPRTPDLDFLANFTERLMTKLSEPITWRGNSISCEASIGAAISGDNPVAADLLAQADFALYEAKRSGRNQAATYDTSMRTRHETKLQRSHELVDALHTDALTCYFQPKMALDSGAIVGVEALVRWSHPKDGLIPPHDLLPIARGLGLVADLDMKTMSFAIQERRKLVAAGLEDIGMSFNASPELLEHPDFFKRLCSDVDQANLDRAQITVEVLETTDFGTQAAPSPQATVIRKLQDEGFQIHLDNGFAGLSHLASLNVTGVKLDRRLIAGLLTDETSQKIVRKIIELSNDLSLGVIAEGVEDPETARILQGMGCNIVQGYWIAKPMPANALHSWLEVRRRQQSRKRA